MKVKGEIRNYITLLFILLVTTFLVLVLGRNKLAMENDEYYSYGLSNYGISICFKEGIKEDPKEVFQDYFYASGLGLDEIWNNQKNDVHPPLYYLCFKVFELLTNNIWDLQNGILLNTLFHICNIIIMYFILKRLKFNNFITLLGTGFYACLPTVLENVLFVRMYTLAATFILLLSLLFVSGCTEKRVNYKFYIALCIVSVGGTLTHYYFLVYLFYSCFIWGIYLLRDRQWKKIGIFIGTMAIAAVLCLMIFPAMIDHIFFGYRGKESFDNLLNSSYVNSLKFFCNGLNEMFGGLFYVFIIFAVIFLLFHCHRNIKKGTKIIYREWNMLIIPCVLYFFTITKIAVLQSTRYIAPIYGGCVILFFGVIKLLSEKYEKKKVQISIWAVILSVVLIASWKINLENWQDKQIKAKEILEIAEEYGKENECIHIFGDALWNSPPSYSEFIKYKTISFMHEENVERMLEQEEFDYSHVVVYIDISIKEERRMEILKQFIEKSPQLEKYVKLYEYNYQEVYYIE